MKNRNTLCLLLAGAMTAALLTAPAQAAKLQGIGSIEAGNLADLVVLDQELNIKAVFIDGQKIA